MPICVIFCPLGACAYAPHSSLSVGGVSSRPYTMGHSLALMRSGITPSFLMPHIEISESDGVGTLKRVSRTVIAYYYPAMGVKAMLRKRLIAWLRYCRQQYPSLAPSKGAIGGSAHRNHLLSLDTFIIRAFIFAAPSDIRIIRMRMLFAALWLTTHRRPLPGGKRAVGNHLDIPKLQEPGRWRHKSPRRAPRR